MNALGQTPKGPIDYEAAKKKFNDEYWPEIQKVIEKRDSATGSHREELDLEIHQRRTDFMMSVNKSGFPLQCSLGTPTPLPTK